VALLCILTPNRAFGNADSSSNASPGLEAFDVSNLPFIIGKGWNWTKYRGTSQSRRTPLDTEASDDAALALAGVGFALAGIVGRFSRISQRLNVLDDSEPGARHGHRLLVPRPARSVG